MQRTNDFIRGVAGLTLTAALLLGLPIVLLATVGWPLPTAWPGADTISRHVTDGDIPDAFLIKLIACVVWIVWAQIAVATVLEYAAIIQGKVSTRTPVMPFVRLLAAKLATWTTLLLSAFTPIRPAMAAPLHPVSAPTTPAVTTMQPDVTAANTSETETPMVSETRYQTVRGDTWWDISERLLGNGMRWDEIRTLNLGEIEPDGVTINESTDTVRPGWLLRVPLEAQLPDELPLPEPAASETVTVEQGDHFWSIAEDTLAGEWGREATDAEVTPYWAQLVEANADSLLPPDDPDMIYPDQTFVVPDIPRNPDLAVDLNGDQVLDTPSVTLTPVPQERIADPTEEPTATAETIPEQNTADPSANAEGVAEATVLPATVPAAEGDHNKAGDLIEDAKPIAALAGALSLLGGTLLYALRRLRRIQAARRRPGTITEPPPEAAAEFERRIKAISTDGEDVRYIAAANDYLSHQLETAATPIPSVIAVRAGQFGLELLLDEPCEPVEGFHAATPDKTAWRLNAELDVRMMEADAKGDAHPFAPALCVVGATEAGSLLVDLEQLGAVSIEGTNASIADFQRGLLASTCVAPWASECEIISIGIDGLTGDELSRTTTPSDPTEWAERTATRIRQAASNLDRSPYEERIEHGIVTHPTIVFIGADETLAALAQHLAPIADLAYSSLVVVSAQPLASEYRVVLEEGTATLEPFGLTFDPVTLAAGDLEAIDQLVANASDTSTSPPADDWAEEIADAATAARAVESDFDIDLVVREAPSDAAPASLVETESREPSAEALEAIAVILEPRPIEVRILGRHPTISGVDGDPTPKIEAIITYLAFHREVAGQRLRDEFWPGSASRQGCDNAISRVRTLLGESADGTPRLETRRATHSYRISDDIGLDWHRAEQLVVAAKGQQPADEAAYLDAACELIEGHIAADASPANYGWLLREPTIYTLIETTLVDAAHRRGELALAAGNSQRADWAARKGLTIVEGQESMYRMRMEAASEAGDLDGVNSAYREARRAAESYGYDEEVQPETQALFEKLTRAGRDARSSDSAVR